MSKGYDDSAGGVLSNRHPGFGQLLYQLLEATKRAIVGIRGAIRSAKAFTRPLHRGGASSSVALPAEREMSLAPGERIIVLTGEDVVLTMTVERTTYFSCPPEVEVRQKFDFRSFPAPPASRAAP